MLTTVSQIEIQLLAVDVHFIDFTIVELLLLQPPRRRPRWPAPCTRSTASPATRIPTRSPRPSPAAPRARGCGRRGEDTMCLEQNTAFNIFHWKVAWKDVSNVSGSKHSSWVKIHWSDAAPGGTRAVTGWGGRGTTTGRSTGRRQPSSPTCPRRWAAAADTTRPGRGGGRGGGGARGRARGTAATSPRTRTTTAWAPGCPPSPPPRWTRRPTATARPPGDLSTRAVNGASVFFSVPGEGPYQGLLLI